MKISTTFKLFVFALSGILAVAISTGCKKDKKTIATITVVNEDGAAVPGATVKIYSKCSECPPPEGGNLFDTTKMSILTQVTNGVGKVSYDFSDFYKKGQAGFAVLDIIARKGAQKGEGIIKIEEETTTEETVTIK